MTVHDGQQCKQIFVRNISFAAQQVKLQSEYQYQQALIQSRQHENLTPLNAVLNMSELLLEDPSLDQELKDMIQIIWSSGKILEHNINSQITQFEIEKSTLKIKYVLCDQKLLSEIIMEVLEPLMQVVKERKIKCKVLLQKSVP